MVRPPWSGAAVPAFPSRRRRPRCPPARTARAGRAPVCHSGAPSESSPAGTNAIGTRATSTSAHHRPTVRPTTNPIRKHPANQMTIDGTPIWYPDSRIQFRPSRLRGRRSGAGEPLPAAATGEGASESSRGRQDTRADRPEPGRVAPTETSASRPTTPTGWRWSRRCASSWRDSTRTSSPPGQLELRGSFRVAGTRCDTESTAWRRGASTPLCVRPRRGRRRSDAAEWREARRRRRRPGPERS